MLTESPGHRAPRRIGASVSRDAWPSIRRYHTKLHQRPSFARAFEEEKELYVQEVTRGAAPSSVQPAS